MNDEGRNYLVASISVLCYLLELYYEKKVYLLIDEYDTPFISANDGRYYENIRGVLAELLSSSLKGNPSLEKAMLIGVQRVAKEKKYDAQMEGTVYYVGLAHYGKKAEVKWEKRE